VDKAKEIGGKGSYMIYHGNLSVPENEDAVFWLLENLKPDNEFPMVIAGKKPNQKLKSAIEEKNGFRLVENPGEEEMTNLIRAAHIHVLPTFQSTGVKLKLIKALFQGRFVMANPLMMEGTGLEDLCYIFKDQKEMNEKIALLREMDYSESEQEKRAIQLQNYNDQKAAKSLIEDMFSN
jgi:diadenosine tetraphosphate (Ap4A) HIT family hydrolase